MADSTHIEKFTKGWEGGLSRAKTDYYSKYPSGCLITYGGQTASDWHTNKGITWVTFESASKNLGFPASCKNFSEMPIDIWRKIYKSIFWNPYYLDQYKSQAIADLVVSWAWGSGKQGAYQQISKLLNNKYNTNLSSNFSDENARKIKDKLNELTEKNEKKIFDELIEAKRNFLKSLNQPDNINGWLNRLNSFYAFELNTIKSTVLNTTSQAVSNIRKNWVFITVGILGLIGITYALVSNSKSKA